MTMTMTLMLSLLFMTLLFEQKWFLEISKRPSFQKALAA